MITQRELVSHGRRLRWRGRGNVIAYADSASRTVRPVIALDEVAAIALDLPEASEGESRGNRTWSVAGRAFAWERPFSKADVRRYGDETPPDGPILAIRVADLGEKEAVLAANPRAFFTIPHFDGYAAVLVQLKKVTRRALREAIVDGWLACAPEPLADGYVEQERARRRTKRRRGAGDR